MNVLDTTPAWAGWASAVALASVLGLSWGLSTTTGRVVGRRVWFEYLGLTVVVFLVAVDTHDVWAGMMGGGGGNPPSVGDALRASAYAVYLVARVVNMRRYARRLVTTVATKIAYGALEERGQAGRRRTDKR